nr:MAG TPA: hypothetical protein [Caudoviricetes sp.]
MLPIPNQDIRLHILREYHSNPQLKRYIFHFLHL